MTTRRVIRDYHQAAGGWGALKAVAVALTEQDTEPRFGFSSCRHAVPGPYVVGRVPKPCCPSPVAPCGRDPAVIQAGCNGPQ
jgi:hypothetical protein